MAFIQLDSSGNGGTLSSSLDLSQSNRYISILNAANVAVNIQLRITGGDAFWTHPDGIVNIDTAVHRSHTGRISISNGTLDDNDVIDIIGLEAYSGIIIPFTDGTGSSVTTSGSTVTTPHGTSSANRDRIYFGFVDSV